MLTTDDARPYGSGRIGGVGALSDRALAESLRRYKRLIAKRYRVIPAERAEQLLPEGPLLVSGKIDGQLWFLAVTDGVPALCASNGRVIDGIPLLERLASGLAGFTGLFAGELWVAGDGGRCRVHQVTAALGDPERCDDLRFAAFDLLQDGDTDALGLLYAQRHERLTALLDAEHRVSCTTIERDGLPACYQDWVLADRYEGLVVRSEQGVTYKIKPSLTIDAVVVAYGARISGDCQTLRELALAVIDDEGGYQLIGSVGSGFSDADRLAWCQRLSGLVVDSDYRLANSEGTLCHFVRPEIVVEVRCSDLLTSDGHDRPIRRMRLRHDADGYRADAERSTAVLLHPRFERERDDKPADADHVGLSQLSSRVDLPEDDRDQAAGDLAAASVIERGVWVKTTKGRQAVRKYLLVQTNKTTDQGFSPFALFSTDYSPGRAEPLKTTLEVAADLDSARSLVEQWQEANVKRGWNPAASTAH